MKRLALIKFCILWLIQPAHSQKISFLAQGGLTRTHVSLEANGTEEDEYNPALGHYFGIAGQAEVNPFLDIQFGLAYERMGHQIQTDFNTPQFDIEFDYSYYWDYLKTPLLVQFKMGTKLQYTLQAGGYAGYLLRFTEFDNRESINASSLIRETKDLWTRFDYGIIAGMGVQYISDKNLVLKLDIRYTQGLEDIEFENNDFLNITSRMQSIGLIFGMGYRMAFEKKKLPGRGELPKW